MSSRLYLILVILLGAPALGEEIGIRVIVHRNNITAVLSKKQISDIFLKKVAQWPDKTQILPVDLKYNNAVRGQFSKLIHGRSPSFIKNYWQQKIFAGYELPPAEKVESEVLETVGGDVGAIGYVSGNTPLPKDVKQIEITD